MIWSCIVVCRLLDIFKVLGEPFFAVVGHMVLWLKSTSSTFRLHSSTGLNPVSLLILSLIDNTLPDEAMSFSSFSLVGRQEQSCRQG